jgi:hypothetical protein
MKQSRFPYVAVAATLALSPAMAAADDAPATAPQQVQSYADPDAHTHHGLWMRVMLGPAGFDARSTIGSDKYEAQGGGAGFSLAAGYALTRHLVLYAEAFDDIAVGPTVKMNGTDLGSTGSSVSAGVVGIGPGIAYFTDSNFHLGLTVAAARLTVSKDNTDIARSNLGFGVNATLGKQWWVSDSWGIGVAGQVFVGAIPDASDGNPTWTTAGVSVAFNASYN